ncbi:MAG TPA: DUF1569 domain-containing protein [Cyclobacteriaceae bacterium]|nr:DUF1569 domain-containing protein [Cyclobacteriaceae bacterium]
MKSLFNEIDYQEIRKRIEGLTAGNQQQWGKMNVAQMLAHCSIGFEIVIGKLPFEDKSNFILRTLGKRIVLSLVKKGDLGKNQRTFSLYKVTEDKEFETEKARLLENVDSFYKLSDKNEIGRHPYFGKLSKDDWGAIQYVHTNHHLTQFSA